MFIPKTSITAITRNKIHNFCSPVSENRGAFSCSGRFHAEVEFKKDIGLNDAAKVVKGFDFLSQIWYNERVKSASERSLKVDEVHPAAYAEKAFC